jgi:hypothetical protein
MITDESDDTFFKMLAYGRTGTGKTTLGVTCPKPLILLSEYQGVSHIRTAAARLGRPTPPIMMMEKTEDYSNVARALRKPKSEPFVVHDRAGNEVQRLAEWPESVVLDSLHDACRMVVTHALTQAPPEKEGGLPKVTWRHRDYAKDLCEKLILGFRDAPVHVLFLAHLEDRTIRSKQGSRREVQPLMPFRELAQFAAGAVNLVGVTYRRNTQQGPEFGVMTLGPSYTLTKPYLPHLRSQEVPNVANWIERMRDNSVVAPAAPTAPDDAWDVEDDSEHASVGSDEDPFGQFMPKGEEAADLFGGEAPAAASSSAKPAEFEAEAPKQTKRQRSGGGNKRRASK